MRGASIFLVVFVAACVVSALIHENAGSFAYGVIGLFVGPAMAAIVLYSAYKEGAPFVASALVAIIIGFGSTFLWPATPILIIYVWRYSSPKRTRSIGGDL